MNYKLFQKKHYTERQLNIKEVFTLDEIDTIKKLVKTIKSDLYTNYEFEILAYQLFRYYTDRNEMTKDELKEVLSLKEKGVTQREYNRVINKIETIYSQIF